MRLFIAVFVALTFVAFQSGHAQDSDSGEKIVYPSPDKKFAIRITYDPSYGNDDEEKNVPREATRAIDLVAMPGKDVLVNVAAEDLGLEGKVFWSADSRWVAFALTSGPRVTETYVYHRAGNEFHKAPNEELSVDTGGSVRNQYISPLRWLKPGTLVLKQFTIFRGGEGDSTIEFTVRFDEQGRFHVINKKKVRSKEE